MTGGGRGRCPPRWRKAGVDSWIGRKPARGALSAENGNIREAAKRVAPGNCAPPPPPPPPWGEGGGAKSDGKTMPPGPP